MNEATTTRRPGSALDTASQPSMAELLGNRRIAIVSYSTLFQIPAGLAMKVRQTVRALVSIGVDAKLVNLVEESLSDFDLVHVFGAFNGNDRVVTHAKGLKKPV